MRYSCQQRKPTLLWGTPLFGRMYFKNIIHMIYKAKTMIGKKRRSLTFSWFPCVVLAIRSHLSEVYKHLQQAVPKVIPHCLPDPILSITLSPSIPMMTLSVCFREKTSDLKMFLLHSIATTRIGIFFTRHL